MKLNFYIIKANISFISYVIFIYLGIFLPSLIENWTTPFYLNFILIGLNLFVFFPLLLAIYFLTVLIEIITYYTGFFSPQISKLWNIKDRSNLPEDEFTHIINTNLVILTIVVINLLVYFYADINILEAVVQSI